MSRFEIEYPGKVKAPDTGLSKGPQKISRAAEAIKGTAQSILPEEPLNIDKLAARGAISALGAPADLLTGALGLGSVAEQVAHQGKGEPFLPKIHETAQKYLPTSENIQKFTEWVGGKLGLSEDFLEPKEGFEKGLSNFIDMAAAFASPLLGPAKIGLKEAAKLTGSDQFAKWAASKVGFGETGQSIAGMGAMLATTLAGAPTIKQKASGLYDASKAAAQEGSVKNIASQHIQKGIKESLAEMERGLNNPAKDIAREYIQTIEGKFDPVHKKIDLAEVAQIKRDINENIFKSTNKAENKAAEQYLKPVKDALVETIKESAVTNPKFANNLLAADELWSAIKQEGVVGNFLKDRVKLDVNELKSPLTASLLLSLTGQVISPFDPTIGSYLTKGGIALGAYSTFKMGSMFKKSAQARKYFGEIIGGSLAKSVPRTLKAIKKLDHLFLIEGGDESPQGRYEISF